MVDHFSGEDLLGGPLSSTLLPIILWNKGNDKPGPQLKFKRRTKSNKGKNSWRTWEREQKSENSPFHVSDLQYGIMGSILDGEDGDGFAGAYFKHMNSFEIPSGRRHSYDDFTMPRNACIPLTVKRRNSFSKGMFCSVKWS